MIEELALIRVGNATNGVGTMPMIDCQECNKAMSDSALFCPNCGKPNAKDTTGKRSVSVLLAVGIFFIPLIFSWFTLRKGYSVLARGLSFSWLVLSIAILFIPDAVDNNVASSSNNANAKSTTEQVARSERLTGPQRNAVRSAQQYLSISGFSRKGLIQQLSSDVGDGYKATDASIAVDSMNVDWNKQAVRSARHYLSFQGFSCDGLIEQLSSTFGDGYTQSQATYGAKQAGAC